MKLILSRKGFDSSAGRAPSPILPDGRLVSLPIPDKQSPISYSDIKLDNGSIAPLVSDLTHGRIPSHYRAHLDPDLCSESLPRLPGWRPIFGQTGAAQGHLRKNGVESGDLFLFFGLFRQATFVHGRYGWEKKAPPCHVIWGWLQIGEILSLATGGADVYDWAQYHPHFHRGSEKNNVLYVSSRYINLGGIAPHNISGAGIFSYFSASRQLTAPSAPSSSVWQLPEWLFPRNKRTPLSYHADRRRWRKTGDQTELRAAARGQEFILNCNEYPESIPWLSGLLQET